MAVYFMDVLIILLMLLALFTVSRPFFQTSSFLSFGKLAETKHQIDNLKSEKNTIINSLSELVAQSETELADSADSMGESLTLVMDRQMKRLEQVDLELAQLQTQTESLNDPNRDYISARSEKKPPATSSQTGANFCPHCGFALTVIINFCPECGGKL